jgi:hypothetical protein
LVPSHPIHIVVEHFSNFVAAISSNGEKSSTGQAAEAQSVVAADHTSSRGRDMFTGQTHDALGPEPRPIARTNCLLRRSSPRGGMEP